MKKEIKLGYEIGTGETVSIKESHSIKHTKLQKLYSNNLMEVKAVPPTIEIVGIPA